MFEILIISNKFIFIKTKNKEDNMYYCRFCDKKYKHCSNRAFHEKKCKPIENPLEQVLQENIQIKEEAEQIKAERDAYKDKIIKLQDKLIKTTRLTTKSFKALNKILMEKSYMNQSNNTNSPNRDDYDPRSRGNAPGIYRARDEPPNCKRI